MSTPIRPELSNKNRYHISKERYYELAHFCRQYPEFKKKYFELSEMGIKISDPGNGPHGSTENESMTEELAILMASLSERIGIVDRALSQIDPYIRESMMICVTLGISFDKISARQSIPICRDYFYIEYRKFFWLLDRMRD